MEEDKELKFLLDKIMRNRNIDFLQYRPQVLRRRIQFRLHLTKCATIWHYIMLLNKDPQEYDRLIESLTIKVSEFFRDPKVFDLLGDTIIPEIISQKQTLGARNILAWSCGAAFGQEAYSIAILFCEALGGGLNDFDVKILATDIDKNALENAPWGSYDRKALRNMKAHLLFKYFSQFQDGNKVRYTVSDKAKNLVTFKRHDVVSDGLNPGMDLVLCRNLLIYFQKGLQEKALRNLHAAISPGGFLVLGKTESIPPHMLDYFEVRDLRERVYRKK